MIEELWELLAKFTTEAHQSVLKQCTELGFNQDAGLVSLNESYNNLNWSCNTLKDAIEKKKLIQLPITIQNELFEHLRHISANHDALLAGTDVVVALTGATEKLFTAVWQYRLNELSGEQLGYQMKLNDLKSIETSIMAAKAILDVGVSTKEALDIIFADAKQQNEALQTSVTNAATAITGINENLTQVVASNDTATATLKTITETNTKAAALLKGAEDNEQQVATHEKAIRALVEEFKSLNTELVANKKTQVELFAEFEKYRVTIDDLIGDASRTGMAASFTSRRKWLIAPLSGWLLLFGGSIVGLVYMGITYIAPLLLDTTKTIPLEQLPMRLALTAPFIWLGWFSARQHGFTSRLREDYAYKEASAKSFEGYKRESKEVDDEMLKKLLEQAIENLGDNPIRIYDGKNNHSSPAQEFLEALIKDEKLFNRFKVLLK